MFRQAELLERKRRKKLRQKEQKAKELRNEDATIRDNFDSMEAEPSLVMSPHVTASYLDGQDLDGPSEISLSKISHLPISEEADSKAQSEIGFIEKDSNTCKNFKPQIHQPSNVPNGYEPPKPCAMSNVFCQIKKFSTSKLEFSPKHGRRDLRVAHTVNNKKVWSRKPKPEREGENLKFRVQEAFVQGEQAKENELLIGSIAVNIGSSGMHEKSDYADLPVDDCDRHCMSLREVNNVKERDNESDGIHGGLNQSVVKVWRRRQEVRGSCPLQKEAEVDPSALKDDNWAVNGESCLTSCSVNGCVAELECNSLPSEVERPGSLLFSSKAARTFLSQSEILMLLIGVSLENEFCTFFLVSTNFSCLFFGLSLSLLQDGRKLLLQTT